MALRIAIPIHTPSHWVLIRHTFRAFAVVPVYDLDSIGRENGEVIWSDAHDTRVLRVKALKNDIVSVGGAKG